MATQGIVSITEGDKVLMKVVAGCDGYNAKKVITKLFNEWPVEPFEAYELAQKLGFGCNACLFVITEDSILGKDPDSHELVNYWEDTNYECFRETFRQPRFNPRWTRGTADYVFVLDISKRPKRVEPRVIIGIPTHPEPTERQLAFGYLDLARNKALKDAEVQYGLDTSEANRVSDNFYDVATTALKERLGRLEVEADKLRDSLQRDAEQKFERERERINAEYDKGIAEVKEKFGG